MGRTISRFVVAVVVAVVAVVADVGTADVAGVWDCGTGVGSAVVDGKE